VECAGCDTGWQVPYYAEAVKTKSSHDPGIPFSSRGPTPENSSPEPAAICTIVEVTKTCPGPARAETLAAVVTAIPLTFSTDRVVLGLERPSPAVPELDDDLGRARDVGEQDRRQTPRECAVEHDQEHAPTRERGQLQ
jgi:hypothetical protein